MRLFVNVSVRVRIQYGIRPRCRARSPGNVRILLHRAELRGNFGFHWFKCERDVGSAMKIRYTSAKLDDMSVLTYSDWATPTRVIEICKRRIRKYDSVVKQEKHEKAEP